MSAQQEPIIAITMGDPAGVGPEIALKACRRLTKSPIQPVIIGDIAILEATAHSLNIATRFAQIDHPSQADSSSIPVISLNAISITNAVPGVLSALCGKAAYAYILKSIELAQLGVVNAVVTCPINKEALSLAGINFPGHTEIFAQFTNTTNYSMVFLLDNVAVAHVTTHCSLRQALDLITTDRVLAQIKLLDTMLKNTGIPQPRIAVGGLNPHAGEHGLFGTEEIEHIHPAIAQAQMQGIHATGPYPPDTVFMRAFTGEFDGIVSMLHDHGFTALKSRDFKRGVNITIGLPIVRTSVGHGTGFDIAGKGIASEESLLAAIECSVKLSRGR